MQLRPEPVQFPSLRIVEHEAAKVVVLAVVKREGHHFIHGHNLRVAERGRKQLAEFVERGLDPLPRCAAVVHEYG